MIDTKSIDDFVATLPEAPLEIEEAFLFRMRLPDAVPPATASLAQRGYLGCLPFAHQDADEFVLRFLPGTNLNNSPVAVAWWSATEGITIAPDLKRFLAGFMAYSDAAAKEISELEILLVPARLLKLSIFFFYKIVCINPSNCLNYIDDNPNRKA
jgi:hypothetical protein